MPRLLVTTIIAVISLFVTQGVLASSLRYCGNGCQESALGLAYEPCDLSLEYYTCACQNPTIVGTVALCIEDYCGGDKSIWKWLAHDCLLYGSITIPEYDTTLANATQFLGEFPADLTDIIHAPVHIPYVLFEVVYRTSSTFYFNMRDATLFGWVLAAASVLLCAIAGIRQLYLSQWSHVSLSDQLDGRATGRSSPLSVYMKKWLFMPALFGKRSSERPAFWGFTLSIPTRLQSLLLFFYLLVNGVALGVRYFTFLDNIYWPGDIPAQLTRYVADRSGVLSFANIPLMIAFAGRNNILMWLTGSSFSTFNVFHKWIGRVCVAHAFIHSVTYTMIYWDDAEEGGIKAMNEAYLETYLRWGAVATVAGCIILFQGMHVFRRYAYETFLLLHISLAIAFIVGCYYHVHLIDYDIYLPWIYAGIAIWAFDRFIRLVRMAVFNFRWSPSNGFRVTKAIITPLEKGFVRLDVVPTTNWKFTPGQYVYLYVGGSIRDRPWESHPFTVYSYDVPDSPPSSASTSLKDGTTESPVSPVSLRDPNVINGADRVLRLYIRPYGGMTKRLAQLSDPGTSLKRTVLIEGPYGHGIALRHYDNVLLVAGGVGITAIMPYFAQLTTSNTSKFQKVHIIWAVHELSSIKEIYQHLIRLSSEQRNVSIYITGQSDTQDGAEAKIMDELDHEKGSKAVEAKMGSGRPKVREIIDETAQQPGSLAVVACGPGGMIDDCRAACVANLSTKRATIEFFSEDFGW